MKPKQRRRIRTVTVHVRIDGHRRFTQKVEVVLKIHLGQCDGGHEVQDHDQVAEVFVIDDRVYEERNYAQNPEGDQPVTEQVCQVEAELEVVVAVAELDDQTTNHHHENEHNLDQHQREQLASEEYPFADGERIHDLVELRVSLAPDQFAGVKSDDHQNEKCESAAAQFQYAPSDRIHRSGKRIVDAVGRKDG